jgi:two-component system, NtrC family, response regulator GlrR
MLVTLIARDQVPLDDIADHLQQQGVEGLVVARMRELLHGRCTVNQSGLAVLISLSQDIVDVGEAAGQVRHKLGDNPQLIVCMLRPSDHNAQTLLNMGVNEIINPETVDADSLAERILGHLVLSGHIKPNRCGELRGGTRQMREIFRDIELYAPLNEAVLIRGETGTGKGLVARALHQIAARSGELIRIDCSVLPAGLIESELFGHVKGGYTDAKSDRVGLIEGAKDGTAFVDEIGDLDPSLQMKLLGVVEDKVFRPVGTNSETSAKTRFIFATHRNLERRIQEERFRSDLYARINRLVLELPPLRERRADIPLLVHHFITRFNEANKASVTIAPGAVDELFHYDWPLNVRELDDVVCRAAAKASNKGVVSHILLRESIRDPRELQLIDRRTKKTQNSLGFDPLTDSWPQVNERAKREYFTSLAKVAQSMDRAIAMSGVGRAHLYKIFNEYGIKLK